MRERGIGAEENTVFVVVVCHRKPVGICGGTDKAAGAGS